MTRETIMYDLNKSDLENVCREFFMAFQGVLSWKWDSWFETALAEFSVDNKDTVREILGRYLSIAWDSSNIAKAPDAVRMIASRLGGLRSGQLLFASDSRTRVSLFLVPGGHGATERPSLFASPHSTRDYPIQRSPNSSNFSKAGSDSETPSYV
jgi:hypothetical protein